MHSSTAPNSSKNRQEANTMEEQMRKARAHFRPTVRYKNVGVFKERINNIRKGLNLNKNVKFIARHNLLRNSEVENKMQKENKPKKVNDSAEKGFDSMAPDLLKTLKHRTKPKVIKDSHELTQFLEQWTIEKGVHENMIHNCSSCESENKRRNYTDDALESQTFDINSDLVGVVDKKKLYASSTLAPKEMATSISQSKGTVNPLPFAKHKDLARNHTTDVNLQPISESRIGMGILSSKIEKKSDAPQDKVVESSNRIRNSDMLEKAFELFGKKEEVKSKEKDKNELLTHEAELHFLYTSIRNKLASLKEQEQELRTTNARLYKNYESANLKVSELSSKTGIKLFQSTKRNANLIAPSGSPPKETEKHFDRVTMRSINSSKRQSTIKDPSQQAVTIPDKMLGPSLKSKRLKLIDEHKLTCAKYKTKIIGNKAQIKDISTQIEEYKSELINRKKLLYDHYHDLLITGSDARGSGFSWAIKKIWEIEEKVNLNQLPDYLDHSSVDYLIKVGEAELEISEIRAAQREAAKQLQVKLALQNMFSFGFGFGGRNSVKRKGEPDKEKKVFPTMTTIRSRIHEITQTRTEGKRFTPKRKKTLQEEEPLSQVELPKINLTKLRLNTSNSDSGMSIKDVKEGLSEQPPAELEKMISKLRAKIQKLRNYEIERQKKLFLYEKNVEDEEISEKRLRYLFGEEIARTEFEKLKLEREEHNKVFGKNQTFSFLTKAQKKFCQLKTKHI